MLCKNANAFKNLSSELAGNVVKKLPVTPNKFNNDSTEQHYTNAEKTLNPAVQHWKLLKRIYLAWTRLKFPVRTEYRRTL